jgi:hypothetical protein
MASIQRRQTLWVAVAGVLSALVGTAAAQPVLPEGAASAPAFTAAPMVVDTNRIRNFNSLRASSGAPDRKLRVIARLSQSAVSGGAVD